MPRYDVSLEIEMESALCAGALADALRIGVDRMTARTSNGALIIPASTLKGKIRYECERILRALNPDLICRPPQPDSTCPRYWRRVDPPRGDSLCPVCEIFGGIGHPSLFYFSDAKVEMGKSLGPGLDSAIRPGVSISRRRRAAESERLYFMETSLPNAGFIFKAEMKGLLPSRKHLALVIAGLRSLIAFGGGRSRGLGWFRVRRVDVREDGNTIPLETVDRETEEFERW